MIEHNATPGDIRYEIFRARDWEQEEFHNPSVRLRAPFSDMHHFMDRRFIDFGPQAGKIPVQHRELMVRLSMHTGGSVVRWCGEKIEAVLGYYPRQKNEDPARPDPCFYISFVMVDAPLRGQGIFFNLMKCALQQAAGFERLELHLGFGNTRAETLYQRLVRQGHLARRPDYDDAAGAQRAYEGSIAHWHAHAFEGVKPMRPEIKKPSGQPRALFYGA